MRDYEHLMSFWRDKRTGQCHISLKGTTWPLDTWEEISAKEYREWQKVTPRSKGGLMYGTTDKSDEDK